MATSAATQSPALAPGALGRAGRGLRSRTSSTLPGRTHAEVRPMSMHRPSAFALLISLVISTGCGGPVDPGTDAGPDIDAGVDAGLDAGTDAGIDAGVD